MVFVGPLALETELLNEIIKYSDTREFRSQWPNDPRLPVALRNLIFAADFHTELTMNGVWGFLENSTGAYLAETIKACSEMGAVNTAATLARIQIKMFEAKISHASLRQGMASGEEFQISSFAESHPEVSEGLFRSVQEAAEPLYEGGQVAPELGDRFEPYVLDHFEQLSLYMASVKQ